MSCSNYGIKAAGCDSSCRPSVEPAFAPATDCTSSAAVSVETGGGLRLLGQGDLLAADTVARSEVLTNIAETAERGDAVPLPVTGAMMSAWLAAVAARMDVQGLLKHGEYARNLAQTLVAADALGDSEIVAAVCDSQKVRVRTAAATLAPGPSGSRYGASNRGVGVPTDPSEQACPSRSARTVEPSAEHAPQLQQMPPSASRYCPGLFGGCGERGSLRELSRVPLVDTHCQSRPLTAQTAESSVALPTRVHDPSGESKTMPVAEPDHDADCLYSEAHPLPWLEQVVASIPTDLARRLMHAAFAPAAGLQELRPLLEGKPPHLQALALQACTPAISQHSTLSFDIPDDEAALYAAQILPHLPPPRALHLRIRLPRHVLTECSPNSPYKQLLAAVCCPEHLEILQKTLVATIGLPPLCVVADVTAATSELESVGLSLSMLRVPGAGVAGPPDPAGWREISRQTYSLPRLTRLELGDSMAADLAPCISRLTELRELIVSDRMLTHPRAVAVANSAAACPQLSSLKFGMRPEPGAETVGELQLPVREMLESVPVTTQLRALVMLEGALPAYSWYGARRTLCEHAVLWPQLTRLELSHRAGHTDMMCLGHAIACMPSLAALALTFDFERKERNASQEAADDNVLFLLSGMSRATRLSTLALTGLHVPIRATDGFVRALVQLPALRTLALTDVYSRSRSQQAASTFAKAMTSGAQLTGLQDLTLHSRRVDMQLAHDLVAAAGTHPRLTSLGLPMLSTSREQFWTPGGPDLVGALARCLQQLPNLKTLRVDLPLMNFSALGCLRHAFQRLGALTELALSCSSDVQLKDIFTMLCGVEGLDPAARAPAGVEAAKRRGRLEASPGCQGCGLLQLQVLDVSRFRLQGVNISTVVSSLEDVLVLPEVMASMPQLREIRVRRLPLDRHVLVPVAFGVRPACGHVKLTTSCW